MKMKTREFAGFVFNRWQFTAACLSFVAAKLFGVLAFIFAWSISQIFGAFVLGAAFVCIVLSLFFGFWNMKEENKVSFKMIQNLERLE